MAVDIVRRTCGESTSLRVSLTVFFAGRDDFAETAARVASTRACNCDPEPRETTDARLFDTDRLKMRYRGNRVAGELGNWEKQFEKRMWELD